MQPKGGRRDGREEKDALRFMETTHINMTFRMFRGIVITRGEMKELPGVSQTHMSSQRHEPTFTGKDPRTGHHPQVPPYHLLNLDKALSQ